MFRKASLFAVFALASCAGTTSPVYASPDFGDESLLRFCEARGAVYLATAAARVRGDSWASVEHNVRESRLDAATRVLVRDAYYGTEENDTEIDMNRRANEVITRCYRTGGAR